MSSTTRMIYRRELLSTLDHLLFVLFVYSYLLSPSHLLTLLFRLTSQTQFSTPTRFPGRGIRFLLTGWLGINSVNITLHSLVGSQGIKGTRANGSGLLIDFIGQSYVPTLFRLISIDLSIAALQFLMIIIAFGDSYPLESGQIIGLDDEEEEGSDTDEEGLLSKRSIDPLSYPIINIRFRAVLKEAGKNFGLNDENGGRMRSMEEGRSTAVVG